MALRVQTQITGDVFVFLCDGRIVYGDEGAALRERVGNILPGTPRIVHNRARVSDRCYLTQVVHGGYTDF